MSLAMPTPSTSSCEAPSRPGLTSLLRTSRGLMTVQTEIIGSPAQFVSIVDFRGRVLKTWKSPHSVDPHDPQLPAMARRWHQEIEARVRESLTRASQQRRPDHDGETVAHLFAAAVEAYANRDLATARAVFATCALLRPDEPRIRAALDRLGRH